MLTKRTVGLLIVYTTTVIKLEYWNLLEGHNSCSDINLVIVTPTLKEIGNFVFLTAFAVVGGATPIFRDLPIFVPYEPKQLLRVPDFVYPDFATLIKFPAISMSTGKDN